MRFIVGLNIYFSVLHQDLLKLPTIQGRYFNFVFGNYSDSYL